MHICKALNMPSELAWAMLIVTILPLAVGCGRGTSSSSPSDEPANTVAPPESLPPLTWIEKGLAHDGLTIDLGYRGEWPNVDQTLEPIASLARDGKPVANAMVFHRLVSVAGRETPSDELATVYERSAGRVPGLYAQGRLKIPAEDSPVVVRFRIVLPDGDQEWMRDITIPPH